MKSKKKFLIIGFILVLVVALGVFFYFYFTDENKLTAIERRYIADNSSIVQNISVVNNVDVFGNNGEGIFYDFINDFSSEYAMKTNNVAYNLGESSSGVAFAIGNTLAKNETLFYTGHYVLVSKKNEFINHMSSLSSQKIGVTAENSDYVKEYLPTGLTLISYEDNVKLSEAFEEQKEINYMIVPLELHLSEILSNDYYVACHFSDIKYYYKITTGESTLGSVLSKYFNKWSKDSMEKYYREHLFDLFVASLDISVADIDAMRSVSYNYGFVNNSPYEILSGGNFGGVIAQYLKEFKEFSDIELKFIKYKNANKLINAIQNKKVDFSFSYYDISGNLSSVHSGIALNYSVIANKEDELSVNSLKSLNNKTVYVEKGTILYSYLKKNTRAEIKTYETEKELEKIVKNGGIILLDNNVFSAHQQGIFSGYSVRFNTIINTDYVFKLSTNDTFTKLFTKYINIKDPVETVYKGIYNYEMTLRAGTITGTIARYFMYVLIVAVLVFLYVYKLAKKVRLSKKLKKEDKLKYIDQLTSLKNRNYLSENLEQWSKNTIYPQSVVVIDLNNLQEINDTMGYEQGDEQIKAAANILVKTQLDNSDIIRTDGNEFVIYLVGYQTKQMISYIHKLNKEFKKLPHEYGAAIGYSMILDNIKTVEDAINEAVEDVKKQKENKKEGNQ